MVKYKLIEEEKGKSEILHGIFNNFEKAKVRKNELAKLGKNAENLLIIKITKKFLLFKSIKTLTARAKKLLTFSYKKNNALEQIKSITQNKKKLAKNKNILKKHLTFYYKYATIRV